MTNREIISGLRRILATYNEIRKDDAAVNAIEEAIEKIKLIDKTAAEVMELAIAGMRRGQS